MRYFHLDFTIIFTAAPHSPKMRNITAERRVSVGLFAPLVGQASSRGAQLFGRIVYTEHWLRREGFAPRQIWRAPP